MRNKEARSGKHKRNTLSKTRKRDSQPMFEEKGEGKRNTLKNRSSGCDR